MSAFAFMDAEQIAQMSPPVLLGVVLFFIGQGLKQSPIQNWLIPWILMLIGATAYPLITSTINGADVINHRTVASPLVFNILVGIGIGALPTWGFEAVTQFLNRKHDVKV